MTLYLAVARLTIACYAVMAVAAARAGLRQQAVTAALFAAANAVIFLWPK